MLIEESAVSFSTFLIADASRVGVKGKRRARRYDSSICSKAGEKGQVEGATGPCFSMLQMLFPMLQMLSPGMAAHMIQNFCKDTGF